MVSRRSLVNIFNAFDSLQFLGTSSTNTEITIVNNPSTDSLNLPSILIVSEIPELTLLNDNMIKIEIENFS